MTCWWLPQTTFLFTTSLLPSYPPTLLPSYPPTLLPSYPPTLLPSYPPTLLPSYPPTLLPSYPPTLLPSYPPTLLPSYPPTLLPSYPPAVLPSCRPAVPDDHTVRTTNTNYLQFIVQLSQKCFHCFSPSSVKEILFWSLCVLRCVSWPDEHWEQPLIRSLQGG